jgi:hypothetical protein
MSRFKFKYVIYMAEQRSLQAVWVWSYFKAR